MYMYMCVQEKYSGERRRAYATAATPMARRVVHHRQLLTAVSFCAVPCCALPAAAATSEEQTRPVAARLRALMPSIPLLFPGLRRPSLAK